MGSEMCIRDRESSAPSLLMSPGVERPLAVPHIQEEPRRGPEPLRPASSCFAEQTQSRPPSLHEAMTASKLHGVLSIGGKGPSCTGRSVSARLSFFRMSRWWHRCFLGQKRFFGPKAVFGPGWTALGTCYASPPAHALPTEVPRFLQGTPGSHACFWQHAGSLLGHCGFQQLLGNLGGAPSSFPIGNKRGWAHT